MKLHKKLKSLRDKKTPSLFLLKREGQLLVGGVLMLGIFFVSGLTYIDTQVRLANKASYTSELASLPVSDDYFTSGFVTPASCGVISYTCGGGIEGDGTDPCPPVDYPHWEWGGACQPQEPINGTCSTPATHYNCAAGVLGGSAEYPNASYPNYYAWQWTCFGYFGGTDANCVELKPAPPTVNVNFSN